MHVRVSIYVIPFHIYYSTSDSKLHPHMYTLNNDLHPPKKHIVLYGNSCSEEHVFGYL